MLDYLGRLEGEITASADPILTMRRILDGVLALVDQADGAAIALCDGEDLVLAAAAGSLRPHLGLRVPVASSLAGLAVRSGRAARTEDGHHDQRADREACVRLQVRSVIAVPLSGRGEVLGSLSVTAARSAALTDEQAADLEGLSAFIGATVASAEEMASRTREVLSAIDRVRHPAGSVSRFVADILQPGTSVRVEEHHRVAEALRTGSMEMVYQPIVDLRSREVSGVEALARFAGGGPPDIWFAEAHRAGLGPDLELVAAAKALDALPLLPPDMDVGVNVGPVTAADPRLLSLLDGCDSRRVIIELTEHDVIDDYVAMAHTLGQARLRGARIAVDDTGAGYAGFSHILRLTPDVIKIDRGLTTGIHGDPVRQALAGGVVDVAAAIGATVVAEGVETGDECRTVEALGIDQVQGYYFGRPAPLDQLPRTRRAVQHCLGAA